MRTVWCPRCKKRMTELTHLPNKVRLWRCENNRCELYGMEFSEAALEKSQ